MQSVLIVEDSKMVMKILRHLAQQTLDFNLVFAETRSEALQQIKKRDNWLAAIVDLNLPDAPNGELVDDVLALGIPTIVLTGGVDAARRESLARKGIVDYVLKEGRYSYRYAVNLVNRLHKNKDIKVLVAEDSGVTRKLITDVLKRNLFQVIEAKNGKEALDAIIADNDIQLLLTDYYMPELDGFELIHELRHRHEKIDLVIIGLSSAEDVSLSAKFIKNGANDFLYKPFSNEEFMCRIIQDVESMERLDEMRRMAYSDALTGIGNRRYFVEQARIIIENSAATKAPFAMAMLDIDHFKHINDDYGHDVGDQVLIYFSHAMANAYERFVIARTGGEEFCVLFPGLTDTRAAQLLGVLREQVEHDFVETAAGEVSFTFSGGVSQGPAENLEALMKTADDLLYQAKEAGRNQVFTL